MPTILNRAIYTCLVASMLLALGATAQRALPSSYSSGTKVSYIRTWEPKRAFSSSDSLGYKTVREVKQTTAYVDGLGRPLQQVIKGGSIDNGGSATDMVKSNTYDDRGRPAVEYLAFAANNTGGNTSVSDGEFKLNPFAQQAVFYNGYLSGQNGETNIGPNSLNFAYNQLLYENSPMGRPGTQYAAGLSWVGGGRGIKSDYWLNSTADSVKYWTVTDVTNDWGTYSLAGDYGPGTLFKNVTTDETGKQTIDYKNQQDQLVLRKVQATASADTGTGTGHQGWRCTYYIYDELGNTRLIIQPSGVEYAAANSWNLHALSGVIIAENCFRYEYDKRKRMCRQKLPGKGEQYMVYDSRDRVVLTQDALIRNGSPVKWEYATYDGLNRRTATGHITDNHSLSYHQGQAEATSADYPSLGSYTYEELTQLHWDDYLGLPGGLGTTTTTYHSTIFNTSYGASPEFAEQWQQKLRPDGYLTYEKIKVLGTSTYTYNVHFYDDKGRTIQLQTKNHSNATTTTSFQYNWAGQVIRTIQRHSKGDPGFILNPFFEKNTYDDLGRLATVEQKFNYVNDPWKTVAELTYNPLGKLKALKLGRKPSSSDPLETLNYEYNVRGWLLGANRAYAKDTANQDHYFGFDLAYDKDDILISGQAKTYAAKLYNGNITGQLWKTAGAGVIRKYDYTYDATGQLTSADFNQFTGSGFSKAAGIDYSVSGISYDANGNLLTMAQKGWVAGSSVTIDDLQYTYQPYSNRLKNVVDLQNDTTTLLGDFRSSTAYMSTLGGTKTSGAIDYGYDNNGNVSLDNNKDISSITYNHLNQPTLITIPGKGTITYQYDAIGHRLRKVVVDSTVSPVVTYSTVYVENYVYESKETSPEAPGDYLEVMRYMNTTYGRIRFSYETGKFWDYFLKDQIDNVRVVLTEEAPTDSYAALSYEGGAGSDQVTEQDLTYENSAGGSIDVVGSRIGRPGAFGDTTTNGHYVQLVRSSTGTLGAAKLLKVMAKDRIHAYVEYFYTAANANNTGPDPLTSLLTNLASALSASGGPTELLKMGSSTVVSNLASNADLANLLNTAPNTSGGNNAPKSYLNVVFFDEQFRFDKANSVSIPVAYSPNTAANIDLRFSNSLEAKKNGYVYVYFSNVTNEMVYFDNFVVTHQRGPITQEDHYYPFGLSMAAISSQAAGKVLNKLLFGGKELDGRELSSRHGLEWYDYGARRYDPQIGRWLSPDPSSNLYAHLNPYSYALNNPALARDPDGKDAVIRGTGTRQDPYVVTANYYLFNMTDEQRAAFREALADFNNGGAAHKIKTADGDRYIRFNLTATDSNSEEDATASANADVAPLTDAPGSRTARFGNIVTVGSVGDQNRLGETDGFRITLDDRDLRDMNALRPGFSATLTDLRKANSIHEIGHNLGGAHGDPGSTMITFESKEHQRPDCSMNCGDGTYIYTLPSVSQGGIRAILGRVDVPLPSTESRLLSPRENRNVEERSRSGIIRTVGGR